MQDNREIIQPTYKIKNTEYFVNVDKDRLEETTNRNNVIPFDQVKDTGDGYIIKYDPGLRSLPSTWHFEEFVKKTPMFMQYVLNELSSENLQQLTEDFEKKRRIVKVTIPPLKELHAEGMMAKYKVTNQELISKSDFEIIVDQNLYDLRINRGNIPQLEIYNHPFFVDCRMFEFRPEDDFLNTIRFGDLISHKIDLGPTDGDRTVMYQPDKHSLYKIDLETVTSMPKGVIIVKIPNPWILDPVGAAREKKMDIKSYLRRHRLIENQVAEVIPLRDTILIAQMELNRQVKIERQRQKKGRGRRM